MGLSKAKSLWWKILVRHFVFPSCKHYKLSLVCYIIDIGNLDDTATKSCVLFFLSYLYSCVRSTVKCPCMSYHFFTKVTIRKLHKLRVKNLSSNYSHPEQ